MLNVSWMKFLRPLVIAVVAGAISLAVLPAQQAQAATIKYKIAVLGDSWASGEGNSPYFTASETDGCHQSSIGWAYQVVLPGVGTVKNAERNGTATVQNLSCSGAVTSDLINTSYKGHAPQIGQMSTSTTHVFLSISGNNLKFVDILSTCAIHGLPSCQVAVKDARDNKMRAALKGLTDVLEKIRNRVPNAQVLVTGYAPLIGPSAFFFSSTYSLLKDLALDYNTAERTAVEALRTTSFNVKFVSLLPSFLGHADGDTATAWLFPVVGGSAKAGHPNSSGTKQIAKLVSPLTQLPHGTCPSIVKSGMTGICVKEVQTHLNAWGYSLTVDGDFGPKTKAAVVAFQKRVSLTADGLVGPKTKLKLFAM